jgi:chromosome segregation ATPase
MSVAEHEQFSRAVAALGLTDAVGELRRDMREVRTEMGTLRKEVSHSRLSLARIEGHLEGMEAGLKRANEAADRDAERMDLATKRATDRADDLSDRSWRGRSFLVEIAACAAMALSAYAAFLH